MNSAQFQALIDALVLSDGTEFVKLINQFTENDPNSIINSEYYGRHEQDLEQAYYKAISHRLKSMKETFLKSKEEVSKLFKYSDKLGINFDASDIDVIGIISELHIDSLNNGLRSRIIELVKFFNENGLFERNLTADELIIIHEIKEEDKLLAVNLRDLFGSVSDSLIYYVCYLMPYDYVIWIRNTLKNPNGHRFVMNPNSLRNWTDGYEIYDLVVRNLGSVEDFIKKVEAKQKSDGLNEDMIILEFSPRYNFSINENRIEQTFSERHLVYPKNILKNKEKILDKGNYNFYNLSMVIFGGLGPSGQGFTYSTPRREVIEICLDEDQAESEAIIQFKQFLKRKFLKKFEKELTDLGVERDIGEKITTFLSEVVNPINIDSNYNKELNLTKIRDFLYSFNELQDQNTFKLKDLVEKVSKFVSMIHRKINHKDQFVAWMNLVAKGKLKSEEIAKLISLRGKSHFDVLRERIFLQNKPKWFFKNYQKEIFELEDEFQKIYEQELKRRRRHRNLP
ncbi:MAG: hypothetical protein ACW986_14165 [Promethearchaeota archaeon]|jgi:hypothetical protein